jgi:tellurite resistance protein TerC
MFNVSIALWGGFTLFILAMLALDLGVFQRKPHVIGMKEALIWFAVWTGLALLFNVGIILFHERGTEAGLQFFTGFLVEKSLSIDNVFVFILIFNYFRVPSVYQHKVLFWGILCAIVMRVLFIVGGLALMEHFHWVIYVFGAFLVLTGISMMRKKEAEYDPDKNWLFRAIQKRFRVTDRYESNHFFTRQDGRLWATPLFVVLLAIESSDIVFAVDSIPAIFAITPDPFLVYTSNIFAMLGLRALYFAVAGFMRMFHFLHYGFASIILILGVKMLLSEVYTIPVEVSLVLIIDILAICVIVSLLRPRRDDLKPIFERTERLGLIPFRRLLLIENIIDLADLRVKDAMRGIGGVRAIHLDRPWEEQLEMIRATRFSRYPVVEREGAKPTGVVHLKNLYVASTTGSIEVEQLKHLMRRCPELHEDVSLEEALARFQERNDHLAVVVDAQGDWTGIITIEDVLEELVGRIGDEFDAERSGPPISLADALSPGRVLFELRANSIFDAIQWIVSQIPRNELPVTPEAIIRAVQQREQAIPTYVGRGLALPHARLEGISQPILVFARSDEGIPIGNTNERAEMFFLLLTPSGMIRIQPRLLSEIVSLFESEYVTERLQKAKTPEEVIEAIRAGQQVAID